MYVQWPHPSWLHSGMERELAGKLLFRGPRCEWNVWTEAYIFVWTVN